MSRPFISTAGFGKFVCWLKEDVRKESVAELESSGFAWDKMLQKAVVNAAREWWFASF